MQLRGHHFGDSVDFRISHFHTAARISNDAARSHGTERDDLRNIFPAIFFGDVINDSGPPVHTKIDVDIRQRHALGI